MVPYSNGQKSPFDLISSFVRVTDMTRLNALAHRSLAFLNHIQAARTVDVTLGIFVELLAAFALFVRAEKISRRQLFESGISTLTVAIELTPSLVDWCSRRTVEGRRLCKWRWNVPHACGVPHCPSHHE